MRILYYLLILLTFALPWGCTESPIPLSCKQRLAKSQESITDVHKKYLSCAIDKDCVLVSFSTTCQGACQQAVNLQGEPFVKAAVQNANNTWCQHYQADKCGYSTPKCASPVAKCVNKKCQTQVITP